MIAFIFYTLQQILGSNGRDSDGWKIEQAEDIRNNCENIIGKPEGKGPLWRFKVDGSIMFSPAWAFMTNNNGFWI
jgi:hypothetical protein